MTPLSVVVDAVLIAEGLTCLEEDDVAGAVQVCEVFGSIYAHLSPDAAEARLRQLSGDR